MVGNSSRERSIERLNIRSLVLLGAAFGLVAGLVSLIVTMAVLASMDFAPAWIELNAGMLSVKRPYPIESWLLYLWPVISLVVNAIVAAVIGWLYNIFARIVGPLRIELSD